jgi:hypothetical protein
MNPIQFPVPLIGMNDMSRGRDEIPRIAVPCLSAIFKRTEMF